jgi:hypothetical protein
MNEITIGIELTTTMLEDEAFRIPLKNGMDLYLRAQCWTLATIIHPKACSQNLLEVQM